MNTTPRLITALLVIGMAMALVLVDFAEGSRNWMRTFCPGLGDRI